MRSQWLSEFPLSTTDSERLDEFYRVLQKESELFLGYPCNGVFDYSPLYRFLEFPMNNVGDPYLPSNYHLHSHDFECEVLEIFRQLTGAPAGDTWGYVTNGGTEGNHYGLFLARELMSEGIVYYSQDAHYSIDKILRCLNLHSIMIRSRPDGTMDLDDLRETLRIHRDVPPIVCATAGTTMKGAVDDIQGIQALFQEFALGRHYLHVDAALGGMVLPFVNDAPPWNFGAGIDSIAISGHKMIGSPVPCGVVLAKKQHVERIAQSVEYIGTLDTTLSGSRSAIAPLFLWYAFHTVGIEGFRSIVPQCLKMADYAIEQLNAIRCNAWRHPYSNIVVFDRPTAAVTQQWQLACHGALTHLITMPHVTQAQVDRLVADIQASQSPVMPESCHIPVSETLVGSTEHDIILVGSSSQSLLVDVSTALAEVGISIHAVTAVRVDEGIVVRLRVDDRDRALQIVNQTLDIGRCYGHSRPVSKETAAEILSHADYQSVSEEALLVELEDQAGTLATLMKQCLEQGISMRSVRLLWRGKSKAVVELASPEQEKLRDLLAEKVLMT